VIRADQREAVVRVARVNCAECRGCGLFARDREQVMEFTAANQLDVCPGDTVILKVPSRRLSFSYLIIFGLPILVMLAAYFAGTALSALFVQGGSQGAGIIAAVVAGLISLWGAVKLADRVGLYPTILRVIDEAPGEEGGDATERKGAGAGDYSGKVL